MRFVLVREGRQRTVKAPFRLDGIGLHTGYPVSVIIEPAPENTGIIVVHLESGKEIPALSDYVVDTRFATVLGDGNGTKVSTVEHFLAAFYAMEVDNALIKVLGPEVPILDGSAMPIVERIAEVGFREQSSPKTVYCYQGDAFSVSFDQSVVSIEPAGEFAVELVIDFPDTVIGRQTISMKIDPETFVREISPARTFTFKSEIDWLWSHHEYNAG